MNRPLSRLAAIAVAATGLFAIVLLAGTPYSAEAQQGLPAPEAEAVWNYLQSEHYSNWDLFPGTSRQQARNMPHGAQVTLFANTLAQRARSKTADCSSLVARA